MKKLLKVSISLFMFFTILFIGNSKIKAKVCKYMIGDQIREVNISDNGSNVTVSWSDSGCARTNGSGCIDGYKENDKVYPGILNWSTVDSGKDSYGAKDAYETYSSNEECPGYLAQIKKGANNYFFLSNGSTASSLNNIKTAVGKAKKLGTDTKYFYNYDDNVKIAVSEDLNCKYNLSTDDSVELDLDIKTDGTIKGVIDDSQVYISAKMFSTTYVSSLEKNKCPKVLDSCYVGDTSFASFIKGFVAGGTLKISMYTIIGDSSVNATLCNGSNFAMEVETRTFKCAGDNCSNVDICQIYNDYKDTLDTDLKNYKPGVISQSNKEIIQQYEEDKKVFKTYCNSVLKTLNYVDGNCIEQCIKLNEELAALEIDKGLRTNETSAKCNIGYSVLNIVYNVLKWLKYIAPVLVIILSILDFIKALASQNDEDQKKAQSKFIKRLIVSAILFLLPLIINFMLNTFGLYNSECDITNLF